MNHAGTINYFMVTALEALIECILSRSYGMVRGTFLNAPKNYLQWVSTVLSCPHRIQCSRCEEGGY